MADERLEVYLLAAENTVGKKQRRPICRRKRAGEELTREQVAAIKKGRKLLRKEMKAKGIKEKSDFELTATSMGLYFDKSRFLLWLQWLFHGRGLWALLGALALLLATLFLYATITQMRGHFTINMSDGMFREGFVLSETADFRNPTTHLFCTPAEDVPCISISHIPEDIDDHEGQHNETYFAYTFFIRNEGENTVDYDWSMMLNSESLNLSEACWVMIFEDGEMAFYAEPNTTTGEIEALPAMNDNSRGYVNMPLRQFCKEPERQYQEITTRGNLTYYRVTPIPFVNHETVTIGNVQGVKPMDVHKYTVVIWLEGDDPDCTDELIGGHVGMEINMKLAGEETTAWGGGEQNARSGWEKFWDGLKFWGK